jgi:hypothetical protein
LNLLISDRGGGKLLSHLDAFDHHTNKFLDKLPSVTALALASHHQHHHHQPNSLFYSNWFELQAKSQSHAQTNYMLGLHGKFVANKDGI